MSSLRYRRLITAVAGSCLLCGLLAACGQKGPLRLPADTMITDTTRQQSLNSDTLQSNDSNKQEEKTQKKTGLVSPSPQ
jgi:predicted small lipoprotein YifL